MMNKFYRKLSYPYIAWLSILVVIPLIAMLILSFMQSDGLAFDGAFFTFGNFSQLLEPSVATAFFNSLKFAFLTTIICVLLGYIVAYRLYKSQIRNKLLILTVLILPMWSNLLLRSNALGNILAEHNVLRDLLGEIGISYYINIRGTELAVLIGLIITYLPFMILPIYTALEKIDYSLIEASIDLGGTDTKTFWKVIFPISLKGVVSGSIMVFLPTASGFAIPKILGNGNIILIGTIIENNFSQMNYNLGSLLAIIVLTVIIGSLFIMSKIDQEGEAII